MTAKNLMKVIRWIVYENNEEDNQVSPQQHYILLCHYSFGHTLPLSFRN